MGSPLCGLAFPQVDPDRQGEVGVLTEAVEARCLLVVGPLLRADSNEPLQGRPSSVVCLLYRGGVCRGAHGIPRPREDPASPRRLARVRRAESCTAATGQRHAQVGIGRIGEREAAPVTMCLTLQERRARLRRVDHRRRASDTMTVASGGEPRHDCRPARAPRSRRVIGDRDTGSALRRWFWLVGACGWKLRPGAPVHGPGQPF
jgi:hypothetical protein